MNIMGFVHSLLFFHLCLFHESINQFGIPSGNFIPPLTFEDCFAEILPPPLPPPPRAKSVFKCRTQVSDSMAKFFLKGKISDENFMSSHLLAEVNTLPLNSSILKYTTRAFYWKDKSPTPSR